MKILQMVCWWLICLGSVAWRCVGAVTANTEVVTLWGQLNHLNAQVKPRAINKTELGREFSTLRRMQKRLTTTGLLQQEQEQEEFARFICSFVRSTVILCALEHHRDSLAAFMEYVDGFAIYQLLNSLRTGFYETSASWVDDRVELWQDAITVGFGEIQKSDLTRWSHELLQAARQAREHSKDRNEGTSATVYDLFMTCFTSLWKKVELLFTDVKNQKTRMAKARALLEECDLIENAWIAAIKGGSKKV